MDMKSRNQYLKSLIEKRGYILKSKKEKGHLLSEFCATTGMNKKYVVSKIRSGQYLEPREKHHRKRKSHYTNETVQTLKSLWRTFDYPCGQNMSPVLKEEVDHLVGLGELTRSPEAIRQLKTISARTIDTKLREIKEREGLKNKYQKKIHPILYQKIPVRVFAEQDRAVLGNIQTDLVEHCGQSSSGPFISTISATDIYSGWWQGRAVMNMGQEAVLAGLTGLKNECPFVWQSLHSDNGQSFINKSLYRYCKKEKLFFSRSRPYKKNDNCLVENKNKTHIRQVVGYRRYETLEELEIMNELWEKVTDFKNFFQPSTKLIRKERIGGRIKRKYDTPKTPYRRVVNYDGLSDETKRELQDIYSSLNPMRLRREIEKLQTALYETYEKKQRKSKGRSVRFLIADQKPVSVR